MPDTETQPVPTPESASREQPIEIPATPIESPEAPSAPAAPPPTPSIPEQPRRDPRSFLAKALETIQFRRRAKLEKIIKLAQANGSVTNDQVQRRLRVSDATATRYLADLVRQGRLRRVGTTTATRYEPTIGSNGGN